MAQLAQVHSVLFARSTKKRNCTRTSQLKDGSGRGQDIQAYERASFSTQAGATMAAPKTSEEKETNNTS